MPGLPRTPPIEISQDAAQPFVRVASKAGSPRLLLARWPPSLLLALSVFILIGTAGLWPIGRGSHVFWTDPDTRLWHTLIAIQPLLWFGVLLAVGPDLARARASMKLIDLLPILSFVALLLLPTVVQTFVLDFTVPLKLTGLPHALLKISIFTTAGAVLGMALVAGLIVTYREVVERLRKYVEETDRRLESEEAYHRLKSRVQRLVTGASLIIAVAIVSASALQSLIVHKNGVYPPTLVLAYGLCFTIALALLYVPLQLVLRELARRLVVSRFGDGPGSHEAFKQWLDERDAYETYLGLKQTPWDMFQSGFAVIAPMLASFSTLTVGKQG